MISQIGKIGFQNEISRLTEEQTEEAEQLLDEAK